LPRETAKKLREIARKEGKDRSMLIREILEHGIAEKNIEQAIELCRTGQAQVGERLNKLKFHCGNSAKC
jgi:predicted DNA-binding protein